MICHFCIMKSAFDVFIHTIYCEFDMMESELMWLYISSEADIRIIALAIHFYFRLLIYSVRCSCVIASGIQLNFRLFKRLVRCSYKIPSAIQYSFRLLIHLVRCSYITASPIHVNFRCYLNVRYVLPFSMDVALTLSYCILPFLIWVILKLM